MSVIVRCVTEDDRDSAFRIFLDSYGGGPDMLPAMAELPLTDRWVGEDAGRVVGLLRELRVAQSSCRTAHGRTRRRARDPGPPVPGHQPVRDRDVLTQFQP